MADDRDYFARDLYRIMIAIAGTIGYFVGSMVAMFNVPPLVHPFLALGIGALLYRPARRPSSDGAHKRRADWRNQDDLGTVNREAGSDSNLPPDRE